MSNGNGFDPNNVNDWRGVLHKATAIRPDDPHYAEAQTWKAKALQNIADIESRMGQADITSARDLGGGAAFGLGAARGMSFGLGDLAQKLVSSPEERQAVAVTGQEHPVSSLAGTITGGAVPFMLGGALPGLGKVGTTVALGAAQGAGLSEGGVGERVRGAVLGAALARLGPPALKMAGKVAGRGMGVLGRLAGAASRDAPAAADAVAAAPKQAFRGYQLPTEEPVLEPPVHTPNPDIQQAYRDFHAGKISREDLNAALDQAEGRGEFARGRIPSDNPQSQEALIIGEPTGAQSAKPIPDGPPGSGARAQAEPPKPGIGRPRPVTQGAFEEPNEVSMLPVSYPQTFIEPHPVGVSAEQPGQTLLEVLTEQPKEPITVRAGTDRGMSTASGARAPQAEPPKPIPHSPRGATQAQLDYRQFPHSQSEAARAAHALREAAGPNTPDYSGGEYAPATNAARAAAGHGTGAADVAMKPVTPAGETLGQALEDSRRAVELVQGPPTRAAQQELLAIRQRAGPALDRVVAPKMSQAWRSALGAR